MKVFACLAFISSLFTTGSLKAQYYDYFTRISVEEGLSHGAVSDIKQDSLGFIWIATKDGLSRFDGTRFKIYNSRNSALESNGVSKVFIDEEENMFVGTYNGLYQYNPKYDSLTLIKAKNKGLDPLLIQVNYLAQLPDGSIWIAAESGLFRLIKSNTTFEVEKIPLGHLEKISIKSVDYIKQYNTLILGTGNKGIQLYDLADNRVYQPEFIANNRKFSQQEIRDLKVVNSNIYAGTWNDGLYQIDLKTHSFSQVSSIDETLTINSIDYIDNELWIGYYDGLSRLNLKLELIDSFQFSAFDYSIAEGGVSRVIKDKYGTLWIGSKSHGLSQLQKINPSFNFSFGPIQNAIPQGYSSIFKLDNGQILIGNEEISKLESNPDDTHFDLHGYKPFDQLGDSLFCGSYSNGFGIYEISSNKLTKFSSSTSGLKHSHVTGSLVFDSLVYVSTWGGGLNILNLKTGKFIENNLSRALQSIDKDLVALSKQNDSLLWLATYGSGVIQVNVKNASFLKFQSYPDQKNSLSSNDIISMEISTDSTLWVGSWGKGVSRIDLNTLDVNRFSKNTHLANQIITGIESDNSGDVWLASQNGVYHYDKSVNELRSYFLEIDQRANIYPIGCSAKNDLGTLYFVNELGVLQISPEKETVSDNDPNILYTDLYIDGKIITPPSNVLPVSLTFLDSTESIVTSHENRTIEIYFSIIQGSAYAQYEARLTNFDDSWMPLNTKSSVIFTHLDPGEYSLQIRAKTNLPEFVYSRPIQILVTPPWWTEWWAWAIYLIVFGIFLYLFFTLSTQWAHIQNKLKNEQLLRSVDQEIYDAKQKFFTNLYHEIRTPVTLILNSMDRLSDRLILNKSDSKSWDSIKKNSFRLTGLLNEMIDFRKLERSVDIEVSQQEFVEFVYEVYLAFIDTAEKKGVKLTFSSSTKTVLAYFNREQMEKVIYNLVSNAIKFSPENSHVNLFVETDEEYYYFKVADSGPGISNEYKQQIFKPFVHFENQNSTEGFGLGLYIAKEVIDKHQGQIVCESDSNSGTTFIVKLKLGKEHFQGNPIVEEPEEHLIPHPLDDMNSEELMTHIGFENKTVLIVEDNMELRDYLSSFMGNHFNIIEAANGAEGYNLAIKEIPDLIISDVMMPEMDGMSMTKTIKTDKRTSHIPIVILTSRSSLLFKFEGYENGADAYITKPFNKTILLARVKSLIHNRNLVSDKIRTDYFSSPGELSINSKDEQFLNDLIEALKVHISEDDLNVKALSKAIGMSHPVVYKKVKSLTGLSLVEFVRDFKLKYAHSLIAEGGYSVSEASYAVGFSDVQYFSKMFKKKFEINPSKLPKT